MNLRPLWPRRFVRQPEECEVVLTWRSPDRVVDGAVVPGRSVVMRQAAGSGWRWLGRVWRFRAEHGREP